MKDPKPMDDLMKILIAEDDFTSRTQLQALLTQWRHDVISTCDGCEALAALQGYGAPQLAVLDREMPGLIETTDHVFRKLELWKNR